MAKFGLTAMMRLAACLVITSPSFLHTQEVTAAPEPTSKHIGVNGWDLIISTASADAVEVKNCMLSTTILAQPEIGSIGGRVTIQFSNIGGETKVITTITGGTDDGQPIGIWVDHHLIADRKSKTGEIVFQNETAQSVTTLFKAGSSGAVRFRRNGLSLSAPVSLNGFTRALRTVRQECYS